jgi:hypothetical protein
MLTVPSEVAALLAVEDGDRIGFAFDPEAKRVSLVKVIGGTALTVGGTKLDLTLPREQPKTSEKTKR